MASQLLEKQKQIEELQKVVDSTSSSPSDGRSEDQLECLKISLTEEFEQLTKQIHDEAQAEQVSLTDSQYLRNKGNRNGPG